MRMVRLALPIAAALALVTACSEVPTTPERSLTPSYDTGVGLGSGHRSGSDSTRTTTSGGAGTDDAGIGLGSGH
jgi:hypothetical protein